MIAASCDTNIEYDWFTFFFKLKGKFMSIVMFYIKFHLLFAIEKLEDLGFIATLMSNKSGKHLAVNSSRYKTIPKLNSVFYCEKYNNNCLCLSEMNGMSP